MSINLDIPWERYALIIDLAKRVKPVNPQFGKTALQKLVFFLQEVYQVNCGYNFEFYTYGPYDSQLLSDLDLVEHWGYVTVKRINDTLGGYQIRPTEAADSIVHKDKAVKFLDDKKTRQALEDLVETYGSMSARDLELRATIVYVAHSIKKKRELANANKMEINRIVLKLKPKFTAEEVDQAVIELENRKHI